MIVFQKLSPKGWRPSVSWRPETMPPFASRSYATAHSLTIGWIKYNVITNVRVALRL